MELEPQRAASLAEEPLFMLTCSAGLELGVAKEVRSKVRLIASDCRHRPRSRFLENGFNFVAQCEGRETRERRRGRLIGRDDGVWWGPGAGSNLVESPWSSAAHYPTCLLHGSSRLFQSVAHSRPSTARSASSRAESHGCQRARG